MYIYIYNKYIYVYIYTARGENFLTLNRTRNAWGKIKRKDVAVYIISMPRQYAPSCPVKEYYVNHVSSNCTSVKGKYLTPAQRSRKAPERAKNPGLCEYGAKKKAPYGACRGFRGHEKSPPGCPEGDRF